MRLEGDFRKITTTVQICKAPRSCQIDHVGIQANHKAPIMRQSSITQMKHPAKIGRSRPTLSV
uniref:Uncharacterized protein n=1 Tax=Setaria viridis TaxID=4556 RepID=A0A4V6D260_SETVI|nr:hypothetical protein SEVIR_9G484750v2 [Setaria viridis]